MYSMLLFFGTLYIALHPSLAAHPSVFGCATTAAAHHHKMRFSSIALKKVDGWRRRHAQCAAVIGSTNALDV